MGVGLGRRPARRGLGAAGGWARRGAGRGGGLGAAPSEFHAESGVTKEGGSIAALSTLRRAPVKQAWWN
jgi:hypothetical protein